MAFVGVIHRCCIADCYARNIMELVINLKTNKSITGVNLIHEDPYINGVSGRRPWIGVTTAMRIAMELKNEYLWSIEVTPKFKRLQYYFEIICGNERRYLFEDGLYTQEELSVSGLMKQYFKYAWINPSDVYEPPAWVADTFWYQIMPDSFCRIINKSDAYRFADWNNTDNMNYDSIYGGNIQGIISKLSYLHDLGISGIYLTPIFDSPSNHKYNTTDYEKIDPDFGTDESFKELVEQAHSLGIKVMIDAVFNHSGRGFFAWQDVMKNSQESPYYDWFYINAEDFSGDHKTYDGRYYSFAFESYMPKLNTNNHAVVEYFCNICKSWINKWDIDGIRFDVGNEITHSFIKELHGELKAIKPELFLLGEIWHDADPWLHGDEYDSVMNYPWMESVHNFFVNKNLSAKDFMYAINRCYCLYMEQVNRVLFNFLDSHDVGRVYSRSDNEDVFFQQLALLATMPGTPCIYYGTEIEMDGSCGPYNRKPMPWDEISKGKYATVFDEVKTIIQIRKDYPVLKGTQIHWQNTGGRFINYERPGSNPVKVWLNAGQNWEPIDLNGQRIIYARGYSDNVLYPGGTLITERKS